MKLTFTWSHVLKLEYPFFQSREMRHQEVRTVTCPGAHGGKEPGYRSGCVWLRCLHYFHYTTLPASLVLFICGTTGKEILTLPQGKLMTDLYFLLTTLLRYNSHTIKFSHRYRLHCGPSKFICQNCNPLDLQMWPYLEIGCLKRWLGLPS